MRRQTTAASDVLADAAGTIARLLVLDVDHVGYDLLESETAFAGV